MSNPKPLTAWFGGKARMAPIIAGKLPPHKHYVEPFAGMAGVLMSKEPSQVEVINDLHDGLVTLYRVVRDKELCAELVTLLELTPYARTEWRHCNASWGKETNQVEKARMVYVTLAQNFVGVTKNGSWSFGGAKYTGSVATRFINSIENIKAVCERLRNVAIESAPALNIMQQWENPNTCFYLDPPYLPETRNRNPNEYLYEMNYQDHVELLQFCVNSESKILLSGYASSLYTETLERQGWVREDYEAVASSAIQSKNNGLKGKPSNLNKRTECLWINPAAQIQAKPKFKMLSMFEQEAI